jgi:hypothetical protein
MRTGASTAEEHAAVPNIPAIAARRDKLAMALPFCLKETVYRDPRRSQLNI